MGNLRLFFTSCPFLKRKKTAIYEKNEIVVQLLLLQLILRHIVFDTRNALKYVVTVRVLFVSMQTNETPKNLMIIFNV